MSELYDQIEELMIELEDEDTSSGHTIAIVPGAFKPPHLGHLSMVKQYASQADEVIVLVSSPLKANRGIAGNPITAQQSKEIWEMLLADQGLSNVRVEISPKPSVTIIVTVSSIPVIATPRGFLSIFVKVL